MQITSPSSSFYLQRTPTAFKLNPVYSIQNALKFAAIDNDQKRTLLIKYLEAKLPKEIALQGELSRALLVLDQNPSAPLSRTILNDLFREIGWSDGTQGLTPDHIEILMDDRTTRAICSILRGVTD